MIRRGVVIHLNNFQTERLEFEFPVQFLPPRITDPDAAVEYATAWVDAKLREQIESIVRREAARGNFIDPPLIGEAGPAIPATPPVAAVTLPPLAQPNVQSPAGGTAGPQR